MTERAAGFAPIEAYAAIGDGRTVALVATDGRIDWWPLPTVDAPPVFSSLVSEDGGVLRLAPRDARWSCSRRYVHRTNVLETTYTTGSGIATVVDSLNTSSTGQLPWVELARVVEGVQGNVELEWEVVPGSQFRTARPWGETVRGVPVLHVGDQTLGIVVTGAAEAHLEGTRAHGRIATSPGSRHVLAVVATDDEPLFLPTAARIAKRSGETVRWWRSWDERVRYDGPWQEAVRRSALVLKLLTFGATGAILAAPTTSLPEAIGGERNYDYRFAWVRDMAFAIGAMRRLDVEEEVHASLSWLLDTVRRTAPDVHVFYTLDGKVADVEDEVVPVSGYRGSRPVRSGNRAEHQTQLESFGALFDPVWAYVEEGNQLDERTSSRLARCADRVCDIWTHPDAGLWELTEARQYTASKVGCWTALDRAVRLAAAGQLPCHHRRRWEAERDEVAEWVREHCWSPTKRAYTFYAGTDDLDAAVLLSARIGFDRGDRMRSTIDALKKELARGPLMYRYSGMAGEEGAFLACSFWLVEGLALTGQVDEASTLMDELCSLANDVGLYSEEMDPSTKAMLGNFPQALTHLALVNAAAVVHECVTGASTPEVQAFPT